MSTEKMGPVCDLDVKRLSQEVEAVFKAWGGVN